MLRLNIRSRPRVIRYIRASYRRTILTGKVHVTATTTLGRGDKGQEHGSETVREQRRRTRCRGRVSPFLPGLGRTQTSRYVPSRNSRQAGIKDSRFPARNRRRLPRSESSRDCSTIHWLAHTSSGFFPERSLRVRRPSSSREASLRWASHLGTFGGLLAVVVVVVEEGLLSRARRHEECLHARDSTADGAATPE